MWMLKAHHDSAILKLLVFSTSKGILRVAWKVLLKQRSSAAGNKQTLAVSFEDIAQIMPNPAIWLADQPREMLEILHRAAKDVASEEFRELFKNEEHMEVYVRITNLPIADSLRDIR